MSTIMNKEIKENDEIISDLFKYISDEDEYLIFENSFDSFLLNEKLSKYQVSNSISERMNEEIKEKEYLTFEDFCNFYYKLTENNIEKVWKNLYNLGYNNLLKKN